MNATPSELALIASALAAVEKVLASAAADGLPEVPFFSNTDLGALPPDARAAALHEEEACYRTRPRESAIHFCLTSAGALLDVSQTLMRQRSNPSPREREREWKTLVSHTKVAGRAAYRAALILADPGGETRESRTT